MAELQPDAFAAHLGVVVTRAGGSATASLTVGEHHTNPHGTCHGTVLYAVCGIALAAALNDATTSGVVSAVHIDYLAPAQVGDALQATASVVEANAREDLATARLVRLADGVTLAVASGRATRRPR